MYLSYEHKQSERVCPYRCARRTAARARAPYICEGSPAPSFAMPRHIPAKSAGKRSNNPLDLMREQMDELMGKSRNAALDERDSEAALEDFSDPNIDKFYLCGCSPYELLKGTKCEIFPQLEREGFLKERSEGMRMRWEMLPQEEKDRYGFERDLYELLVALVEEQDRRVARLRERYDRENNQVIEVDPEIKKELESTREEVTELLTQSEVLGEAGDVDEALKALYRAQSMVGRMSELERKATPRENKKQYVDDVSGLTYASTDNEARIADLQAGKQYKAWKAIREKLIELRANPPPGVRDRRTSSGGGGMYGGGGGDRGRDDRRGGYDDRRGGYDDRRGGYDDRRRRDDYGDRRYDDRRYDDRRYDDRRGGGYYDRGRGYS